MRIELPVYLALELAWATTQALATSAARGLESGLRRVALSAPVNRIVDSQVDRLLEPLIDRAIPIALGRLGQHPEPVDRIVDGQLDRLLEPLIDRAMPLVLDRLGQHREQLRLIVREHGEDLTGELVAGVRDRAEAADDTAERAVKRLLRLRRDTTPRRAGPQPARSDGGGTSP
jgi:hypothetical protein